jgi:hypothetical protein
MWLCCNDEISIALNMWGLLHYFPCHLDYVQQLYPSFTAVIIIKICTYSFAGINLTNMAHVNASGKLCFLAHY